MKQQSNKKFKDKKKSKSKGKNKSKKREYNSIRSLKRGPTHARTFDDLLPELREQIVFKLNSCKEVRNFCLTNKSNRKICRENSESILHKFCVKKPFVNKVLIVLLIVYALVTPNHKMIQVPSPLTDIEDPPKKKYYFKELNKLIGSHFIFEKVLLYDEKESDEDGLVRTNRRIPEINVGITLIDTSEEVYDKTNEYWFECFQKLKNRMRTTQEIIVAFDEFKKTIFDILNILTLNKDSWLDHSILFPVDLIEDALAHNDDLMDKIRIPQEINIEKVLDILYCFIRNEHIIENSLISYVEGHPWYEEAPWEGNWDVIELDNDTIEQQLLNYLFI